ncbi:MAG: hypothetical protein IKY59_05315 [Oscillospiraceae bacterium]|nr:hypothetical protein [Oscillospiraceae bacterium]
MTDKNRTHILLDATDGIREEYIEEAAAYRRARPAWVPFAAVAAVLAILLGVALQYQGTDNSSDPVPFFAIRAYAQDGTKATLERAGDSSNLTAGENDLFPGKKVYTLDISLTNENNNRVDLSNYVFECFHRGSYLQPGQSDEQIGITLLEEDDFYGYRIVGWCETAEYVSITIRDRSGLILYQKSMRIIKYAEEYTVDIYTSYAYEKDISTQALMEKLFDSGQRYSIKTGIASTNYVEYQVLKTECGGFAELEQRPDAASLLLQRWVQKMEESENKYLSVEGSGLIGLVLSQDAHWNNLTEEELALIESYGISRRSDWQLPDDVHWERTSYAIYMMDDYKPEYTLTVDYEDKTQKDEDDYLFISKLFMDNGAEYNVIGWNIRIWFDEPKVLIFTVTDGENNVIRQERVLFTPTEDGTWIVTPLDE